MTTINTTGAAERMLSYGTDTGADCLHVVSTAIRNGLPVVKNSTSALNEWNNTPANLRHPGELPPGPGYPMYFTYANYGDVCLSGPNINPMVAIDTENEVYHKGLINYQTIAAREKQLGGKYMGYTEAMSGYTIDNTPVLATNQRSIAVAESRIRAEANTTSAVLELLPLNTIITVDAYNTLGSMADGTNNWYHTTLPKIGWINAALVKDGLETAGLVDQTPVFTTEPTPITIPPTPVVTPPATGPVTTSVVTPPKESDPVVSDPIVLSPVVNPPTVIPTPAPVPVIAIDPTQGGALGTDLGTVADAALTPAGRKKLYNIMTIINGVAVPVYGAGATAALFVGGTFGAEIAIGTGALGVINSIVTAFTTRLASNNVSK